MHRFNVKEDKSIIDATSTITIGAEKKKTKKKNLA